MLNHRRKAIQLSLIKGKSRRSQHLWPSLSRSQFGRLVNSGYWSSTCELACASGPKDAHTQALNCQSFSLTIHARQSYIMRTRRDGKRDVFVKMSVRRLSVRRLLEITPVPSFMAATARRLSLRRRTKSQIFGNPGETAGSVLCNAVTFRGSLIYSPQANIQCRNLRGHQTLLPAENEEDERITALTAMAIYRHGREGERSAILYLPAHLRIVPGEVNMVGRLLGQQSQSTASRRVPRSLQRSWHS